MGMECKSSRLYLTIVTLLRNHDAESFTALVEPTQKFEVPASAIL